MLMLSDCKQAFYSALSNQILDIVAPNELIGVFSKSSLEELRKAHPDAQLLPFDEAYRRYGDGHCTRPTEITEKVFEDAYGCLPPQRVRGAGNMKSFMLCEMYAADIGTFYVRVGERYFTLHQRVTVEHSQLIAMCQARMN
jgi:hypothetical protein